MLTFFTFPRAQAQVTSRFYDPLLLLYTFLCLHLQHDSCQGQSMPATASRLCPSGWDNGFTKLRTYYALNKVCLLNSFTSPYQYAEGVRITQTEQIYQIYATSTIKIYSNLENILQCKKWKILEQLHLDGLPLKLPGHMKGFPKSLIPNQETRNLTLLDQNFCTIKPLTKLLLI